MNSSQKRSYINIAYAFGNNIRIWQVFKYSFWDIHVYYYYITILYEIPEIFCCLAGSTLTNHHRLPLQRLMASLHINILSIKYAHICLILIYKNGAYRSKFCFWQCYTISQSHTNVFVDCANTSRKKCIWRQTGTTCLWLFNSCWNRTAMCASTNEFIEQISCAHMFSTPFSEYICTRQWIGAAWYRIIK